MQLRRSHRPEVRQDRLTDTIKWCSRGGSGQGPMGLFALDLATLPYGISSFWPVTSTGCSWSRSHPSLMLASHAQVRSTTSRSGVNDSS